MSADPIVYKEGMLLKRQRGLRANNTRKLKFQERFCCLTNTSLDYYDPLPKKRQTEGPKGQFAVEKMKIIEPMKLDIFGREYRYALQIGDQQEIMYFVTESEVVRDEWLEAFKLASRDSSVEMLPQNHHGVYGLLNKGRWSCCANTRRDTIGCSTSSSISPRKDRSVTSPPKVSVTVIERNSPVRISPISPTDSELFAIRRFTTTDPIMKPDINKLRKLRQSVDFGSNDKISELDESEELKEDKYSPPSMTSKKRGGSKSRGVLTIAEVVIEDSRSGASSPSPSDDSGHGTSVSNSRPNSQIEDNRIRAESLGKKPNQITIPEQVKEDEPKLTKQDRVEGSADSSKTVTPEETPIRSKFSLRNKNEEEATNDVEKCSEVNKNEIGIDNVDGAHERANRATSSPAPSEGPMQIPFVVTNRPLSLCSNGEGSGSEVSTGETPQQRRIKDKMFNSPRMSERPKSILLKSFSFGLPQYNQLHQLCKDGNMEDLDRICDSMSLEEPSNEEVPLTPLFIAFIHDHMQTMVRLLEHGASPNTTEPVGKASIVHLACEKGCLDVLDLLVKYKADVNKRDVAGNTPLMLAAKNGHLDIVEFLLANGASVDSESCVGRTSLHECSECGETEIMDLLLRVGKADPTVRDSKDISPYDIAFNNKNTEIMSLLQQVTPEIVRPYTLRHSSTGGQMITSLSFKSNDLLISGSTDTHTHFLSTSNLCQVSSLRLTDTVLDLAVFDHTHLAIGSTSIQIVDIEDQDKKQTVADDTCDDESLENPPLHLIKFGPGGRLVTASAENNVVKLWPPMVTQTGGVVTMPDAIFAVGEESQERGCVYCLSVSPSPNCPWLAVGFQPGKMFSPSGNKLVYLYDWERKELKQIFDAGDGGQHVGVHIVFSPCGKYLAIGCAKILCIWNPKTGDLVQKFLIENGPNISSIMYSPNGLHLATGLTNGEVQVFETSSSSSIFFLMKHKESPVTALAYSKNGKLFATGQRNGHIRLWEAYGCVLSNSPSNT